jgi:solute carrier family 25 protein 42
MARDGDAGATRARNEGEREGEREKENEASTSASRGARDEDPDVKQKFVTLERVVSGALAGGMSRVATAPIDRVKLLFQVDSASAGFTLRSGTAMARDIARNEGFFALWRGCHAAVVRILPYSATTFGTFNAYNAALAAAFDVRADNDAVGKHKGEDERSPPVGDVRTRFVAGALAGATATVLTYPLDLLHARLAAHSSRHPAPNISGMFGSAGYLYDVMTKGGARSLYNGLTPTLVGIVPYGGISFATFETLKSMYVNHATKDMSVVREDEFEMPVHLKLMAGGFAGVAAQTATYPLHIVRRRMQVHISEGASAPLYTSVWAGLRTIYATEGFRNGLFKGVTLTWVKGPFAAAIGFTANDILFQRVGPTFRHAVLDEDPPETHVPVVWHERKSITALETLFSGAIAGAVAKSVVAPADRVKIIYQVDAQKQFTLNAALRTARQIIQTEGVPALWRGNGVQMIRVMPYAGVSFLAFPKYDAYMNKFTNLQLPSLLGIDPVENEDQLRIFSRFCAGAAAGATATTMTYPLDMLRARFAATGPAAKGPLADLASLVRSRGVLSLYSGLSPTLIGIIPYGGISFATFETLKAMHIKQAIKRAESIGEEISSTATLPVSVRLFYGGTAGLLAQSITYPLDVVRRRVQVLGKTGMSTREAIINIARTEGVRGLYKGLTMNWVKGPLSVAVSFAVNDAIKSRISEMHANEDED